MTLPVRVVVAGISLGSHHVRRLTLHEEIHRPWAAAVELAAPSADLALESAIGQRIAIELPGEPFVPTLVGIVLDVRQATTERTGESTSSSASPPLPHSAHPNIYSEYECTGPGGNSLGGAGVKADVKPSGGRVQVGGGPAEWGVKKTMVERYRAEDGAIHERRASITFGQSEGILIDGEWSDRRKGLSFDSPWGWGGGFDDIKVGPAETQPAIDVILPPVSADVLLGD